ncbi:MAG: hypothetical protein WC852_05655 [Candidatus Nanoarchaeia archaeon]|jgi:hypothetical protein
MIRLEREKEELIINIKTHLQTILTIAIFLIVVIQLFLIKNKYILTIESTISYSITVALWIFVYIAIYIPLGELKSNLIILKIINFLILAGLFLSAILIIILINPNIVTELHISQEVFLRIFSPMLKIAFIIIPCVTFILIIILKLKKKP